MNNMPIKRPLSNLHYFTSLYLSALTYYKITIIYQFMQEEEGTFKHLKSLNDLQRESGLHHRMLQRLRSFL